MINLTGLWKNKTKDGKTYLSGSLGSARVLIFPVEEKKSEKSPDYNMVIAPNEKKDKKSETKTEEEAGW